LHEVVDENGNIIYIKKDTSGAIKNGVAIRDGITVTPEVSSVNTIPQAQENINSEDSAAPEAAPAPAINTDAESLAPVAKTLGESGAKALTSFYDGQADTGAYSEEFVKTYNAGKNGKSKPAAGVLTEGQSTAAFFAGKNDAKANAPLQNPAAGNTITGEKKFIRAKKSEWNSTDSEWYVPGHKQAIAYSTTATSNSIGAMADDNPMATISELLDMFVYDDEAKKVLSAYIDNGYGDQIAGEWFSYNKKQGIPEKSESVKDDAPVFRPAGEFTVIEDINADEADRKIEFAKSEYHVTDEESDSIEFYVSGNAYEWTEAQRNLPSDEINEYISYRLTQVANGLMKHPVYDGVTYRNLVFGRPGENPNAYDDFLTEYAEGKTVTLSAFSSSSKDPNGYPVSGDKVVHLVITGVSGRDISETYSTPRQKEVIFLPGTKLKITAVRIANDGNPLIFAKEIDNYDLGRNYENKGAESGNGSEEKIPEGKGNDVRAVHGDGRISDRGQKVRGISVHKSESVYSGEYEEKVKGAAALADKISSMLARGKQFNSAWLFEQADKAFGGTMAAGTYTVKDAYDAMEFAVNKTLMASEKVKAANGDAQTARKMTASLENMLKLLPTQTQRSAEMEQFQQFSTPPKNKSIHLIMLWSVFIGLFSFRCP
jgi:hypothetical protein